MKKKIIVIGSANIDMITKVPHIPAPGETVLGTDFFTIQGGKGANQAVAASRAGGEVVFLACVGADSFGEEALEAYAKEKIDISYIKKTTEASTGVALINVAASGENSIAVAPGANSQLMPEDIMKHEDLLADAAIILVQLEVPLETIETAAGIAAKYQIPFILNPAPAQKLETTLLEKVTILTPNEQEAQLLAGIKAPPAELATRLVSMGVKSAIITLGKEGAIYTSNNQEINHLPGIKVKAVDTTAAGDTFNGYLSAELAAGKSLAQAIELANKAAALSVTRLGAQPSVPFRAELR